MAFLAMSLAIPSALILLGAAVASAAAPAAELPGVDALPAIKELPDPFLMKDGSRVKTREDWLRRRDELKELVLAYEYGHLPPTPTNLAAEEISAKVVAALGASEKCVRLSMGPDRAVKLDLILTIPADKADAKDKPAKLPVIVRGDLTWGHLPDAILRAATSRGYIIVEFDRTQLALDSKEYRSTGVYKAYPDCDGGALAAWAWGYHRAVDYLLTQPFVDAAHIAVTGHSRGGKAALLAGVLDERVALVAPNASGAGGASAFRILQGETLTALTRQFPYWFSPRLATFQGKETHLPFDQHALLALVAPRAFFSTESTEDLWANPAGNQQAHLAAREVFEFLGAGDRIGVHYRPGSHDQNAEDWAALLDFADKQFFGKTVARLFDQLPDPSAPKTFSWTAPAAK